MVAAFQVFWMACCVPAADVALEPEFNPSSEKLHATSNAALMNRRRIPLNSFLFISFHSNRERWQGQILFFPLILYCSICIDLSDSA
jgi:hypothetical protein